MACFGWGAAVASEPIRIPGLIKFGEDFDFDFSAHALRRYGRVVKLERIPAEVLAILIERHGQIVSREHIVERIWGKDVFLDTDNSINGAIRKIRQVLKDDVEQPRFVETVSGKGYRFVASVGQVETRVGQDRTHDFTDRPIPTHGSTGTPLGKHPLAVAATAVTVLAVATVAY